MNWFSLLTSVIFLLALSCTANGQANNVRFEHYQIADGLSQQAVIAIFQDNQGFMWFGTQEGLNRFDGYQFQVFNAQRGNPTSLNNGWIHAINQDHKGRLWLGTDGGGLNVFDPVSQMFTHVKSHTDDPHSPNHNVIRAIFRDTSNRMWLGTENGLAVYNEDTDQFTRFMANDSPAEQLTVGSIAQDSEGYLWLGVSKLGLVRFNPANGETVPASTVLAAAVDLPPSVSALTFDQHQRLWVGSYNKGSFRLDFANNTLLSSPYDSKNINSLSNNAVSHIFMDSKDNIWVATEGGLNLWQEKHQHYVRIQHEPDNPYSLIGNGTTQVFEDDGGVLWVGSHRGLNKWNTVTNRFTHYKMQAPPRIGLSDAYVNGFAQIDDDSIWVGTYAGLNRIDLDTQQITHIRHNPDVPQSISDDRIMSLFKADSESLYLGTRASGVDWFNPTTGQVTNFRHDPTNPNSISANGITGFASNGRGKVWVGTFGGGVNLFDPQTQTFRHFQLNPAENGKDRVLSIYRDSTDKLWAGTWGDGLFIYNPLTQKTEHITHDNNRDDSISSDIIMSVTEDRQGNMWIGTASGLCFLSAENRASGRYKFKHIGRNDGLPSATIYGIIEDAFGELWLSSNRGLTRYNPNTGILDNFDISHGLQGNEFNSGAFYRAGDGTIWFGGTNGISAFKPEQITANNHMPPVVLTNFIKLDQAFPALVSQPTMAPIEINHRDYLIAFEFAGLDYAAPANNQYSYKLDGFDKTWINAGQLRRATYTNLPAGTYRFLVKATNNDGVWNPQGTAIDLVVHPAPWYSWWAYTIYTMSAALALFAVVRTYLRKMRHAQRYQDKLKCEVAKRTKELNELNAQLMNACVTDQLTGLNNRRHLLDVVEHECAGVLRDAHDALKRGLDSDPRLVFLMFDLDGFKQINDVYGHKAGDQVISQISQLLQNMCRRSETLIRWGGDEFLIVARVDKPQEAQHFAERLRHNIALHDFDIGRIERVNLSCSIGFSFYPFKPQFPELFSWEQVQLIADRALYYSKAAGRNHWTGLIATEQTPPKSLVNLLTHNLAQTVDNNIISLVESVPSTKPAA